MRRGAAGGRGDGSGGSGGGSGASGGGSGGRSDGAGASRGAAGGRSDRSGASGGAAGGSAGAREAGGAAPGGAPSPHRGHPVATSGPSLEDADRALILVHGRGATAEGILELGRHLVGDGVALLAPQAAGHTWYPHSFMAPLARNQPHLESALELLGHLVGRVERAGIPAERTAVGGFSQGACLASEFVARTPRRWGGLVVFSGGLIGPEGMDLEARHPGSLDGTPVFMGCSDRDPHIPRGRFEETGRVLEGMGAEVDLRVYADMGHTIIQDEVDGARRVLEAMA